MDTSKEAPVKFKAATIVAGLVAAFFLVNSTVSFAAVLDPRLDKIASEFAGRPIVANCSLDTGADEYDWDIAAQLWGVYGVYYPDRPDRIFLSPAACTPLLVELNSGLKDAGMRPFANAVTTLVHESFHARGWVNEADTEACAMRFLPNALADFGIYPTKTIAVKQVRTQLHRKKVGKRVIRWRSSRVVTVYRNVANSDYSSIVYWAKYWHSTLPSEYLNGTCS
jgi:hypothetical protein